MRWDAEPRPVRVADARSASVQAGRRLLAWPYDTETLPQRGVEIEQWISEEAEVDDGNVEAWLWFSPVVGITDEIELALPSRRPKALADALQEWERPAEVEEAEIDRLQRPPALPPAVACDRSLEERPPDVHQRSSRQRLMRRGQGGGSASRRARHSVRRNACASATNQAGGSPGSQAAKLTFPSASAIDAEARHSASGRRSHAA